MSADTDVYKDVVKASRDDIVRALTDFDHYTQWQSGMLECTVKERDEAGRGTLVEFYVDAKVKKLRYTVRYFYDHSSGDDFRMGWDYVGGDLTDCTGRYQFSPTEDGSTEVAIDIVTETGFFVPGPMKKLIRDQSLKNSMRDLKRRVEK